MILRDIGLLVDSQKFTEGNLLHGLRRRILKSRADFLQREEIFVKNSSVVFTCFWACCFQMAVSAYAGEIVPASQIRASAAVEDVLISIGQVSGKVVNRGNTRLEEIKLLIAGSWYWHDERRPGASSPGWAEVFTLPNTLLPGATVSFTFAHGHPDPGPTDGKFMTTVHVVGFKEFQE